MTYELGNNMCIRVLGFLATEMDFGHEVCQIAQKRDLKGRSKQASFTFSRDPRPKQVNRILRPKVGVSLVV